LLLGPAWKLRQNAGHVRMPSVRSKFPSRARRCPAGGGRSSTMTVRRPLPADPLEHSGEPPAARSLDRCRSRRHRGCPSIGRRKQDHGAPLTSGRRFFIFADGPEHLCPSQEGVAHDRLLVPIQPEPRPAQVIVPSSGILVTRHHRTVGNLPP